MTIILVHSFLFLLIIYFNGLYFLKKILLLNEYRNFYEISLIGLIITIFFAQFVNFFIPLNDYLILLNVVIVFAFFFFNKNFFPKNLEFNFRILIISSFLMIIKIYGSDYSDDLDHYHYGFISNADNSNFIWGQSYLHPLYGTSPSWLIGHSFFNFDNYILQDIHILNGIVFFLILGLLLSEFFLNKDKQDKNDFLKQILFATTLFILLKYTRIKEFGIDRPATLFFCFLIYFYFKYFLIKDNKNILKNFILISIISIFIISIKIIYLPILILPLIFFLKKRFILFKFKAIYLILLIPILIFLSKNLLGTGCIFFPFELSCIKYIPWSNFVGAKELSISAEIFNKSWTSYTGDLDKHEYIKNFNWFKTWFDRGKIEIFEYFVTIFFIMLALNFSFKGKISLKASDIPNLNILRISLALIIILSILVYLFKNPVLRMNHHVLISLMVLIITTFKFDNKKIKKIFFINILIFAFIFTFYKNFLRIKNNEFVNNPKSIIINKITQPKKKLLNNFEYFVGWYGSNPIGNQDISTKRHVKFLIFDIIYH